MSILKFDPATGWECEPISRAAYRAKHGGVAWLFNPYTGDRRDARDIGSDVHGHLIDPPVEPAAGPEDVPAACKGANCGCTDGISHSPECIVETAETQGWSSDPEAIEARYKVMVNRFLGWKLPQDFGPDAGILFSPSPSQQHDGPHWPVGTNLLTADQALEMFKHCLPAELIAPAQDDHQCCGKCEKPSFEQIAAQVAADFPGDAPEIDWRSRYMRDVEGLNNEGDPIGGDPAMGLRQVAERQKAIIQAMAEDLQSANNMLCHAVKKLGGVLTIAAEDLPAMEGCGLTGKQTDDGQAYVLTLVQAPPVPQ